MVPAMVLQEGLEELPLVHRLDCEVLLSPQVVLVPAD